MRESFAELPDIEEALATEEGRGKINLSVVHKIEELLGKESYKRFDDAADQGTYIEIAREEPGDRSIPPEPFTDDLPKHFGEPAYVFQVRDVGKPILVSAPYEGGVIFSHVLGADGVDYYFGNIHYFDDLGNGALLFEVAQGDDQAHSKYPLSHLPFTPSESDRCILDLTVRDYRRIFTLFGAMDQGQFVRNPEF